MRLFWIFSIFFLSMVTSTKADLSFQDNPNFIRLGHGPAQDVEWSPDDRLLAVAGSAGIWLYTPDLQNVTSIELTLWQPKIIWSPDSQYLAVQDPNYDKPFAAIYDVSERSFAPILDEINSLQKILWSPDGSILFVIDENSVRIFESESLEEFAQVVNARDVVFSQDGNKAALIEPTRIQIWDMQHREVLKSLQFDEDNLTRAWFSPSSEMIAGADENHVVIWNIDSGELTHTLVSEIVNSWPEVRPEPLIREGVSQVIWTQESDELVVVNSHPVIGYTSALRVWRLSNNTVVTEQDLGLRCFTVEWTTNYKRLLFRCVGGSGYPDTLVIDPRTWEITDNEFNQGGWEFSPDRTLILSAPFYSNVVRLFDADNLSVLHEFDTEANRVIDLSWSPDSRKFATAHTDEVQVWDVETGQQITRNLEHIANIWNGSLTWSSDGNLVAFSSSIPGTTHTYNQSNVRVWDVNKGQSIFSISGHIFFVNTLSWNFDGSSLLMSAGGNWAKVWDGENGNLIQTLVDTPDGSGYPVIDADWDGSNVAAVLQYVNQEATVFIYDVTTSEEIRHFAASDANRIAWRPNSKMFVTGQPNAWTLWDGETGRSLARKAFSETTVSPQLLWSPQGDQLAVIGTQLHIWQVSSDGTEIYESQSFDLTTSFAASWHPSGRFIAVGVGTEIQTVNASTGEIVMRIATPFLSRNADMSHVSAVAWSPDGTQLASFTDYTPYLYIWEIGELPLTD